MPLCTSKGVLATAWVVLDSFQEAGIEELLPRPSLF